MSILVTGGAGFIGSHMILELAKSDERIVVFDNLSTGRASLVPPNVVFVQADLADFGAIVDCIRTYNVQEVIHFAGSIVVAESVSDPLKYYQNNTVNSVNLINAAVQNGVKTFVFSSTAAVYGMVEGAVSEDAALSPLNAYGWSKMMTERMLIDATHASQLRYGILRYFNVAGADPQKRSGPCAADATHLIKVACQAALGQRPYVEIYGTDYDTPDGTGVRDYIHVSDLVKAHALLLQYFRKGGNSTLLNCGYGTGHSVRQVIEAVKAVSGTDFEVREVPRRHGDAASVIANTDKIARTLPWVPKHNDLATMVHDAYAWELHQLKRLR